MKNKVKVVHIITSLGCGGAEKVLYNLVTNSSSPQIEHVVISMKDNGVYGKLLIDKGIKVYSLNIQKTMPWKLLNVFSILRSIKPDVIQSWLYHADFLTILLYLSGYRNIVWNIRNNTLKWSISSKNTILLRRLCALFSFIPKKIICCAKVAMQEHIRIGYAKNKFIIIPNGYDLSLFKPNNEARCKLRLELNIAASDFVIGNVGRDDPAKDRSTLLHSVSLMKEKRNNIKLMLIGANINENNDSLLKLIKKYGLDDNIILLEQQKEINLYYNVMDMFVLSSQAEAFPNVLAEAMATGLPCVTTNAGDAEEIINDHELVVPIGDYEKLFLVANEVMSMSECERLEIGNKLFNRVLDKYSMQAMINSYQEIYIEVGGVLCQKNF